VSGAEESLASIEHIAAGRHRSELATWGNCVLVVENSVYYEA